MSPVIFTALVLMMQLFTLVYSRAPAIGDTPVFINIGTVSITNQVGVDLTFHCRVNGGKALPPKTIERGSKYTFRVDVIEGREVIYNCDVTSEYYKGSIDFYDAERDFTEDRCGPMSPRGRFDCQWNAEDDGLYFYGRSARTFSFEYPWDI